MPSSPLSTESFPAPSLSASQLNSPRPVDQSRGSPRAGHHKRPQRAPAGNRKGNRANDIWPFFTLNDEGR